MDTIKELAALGLELPSPAYFIGATFFSIVGWIAFSHRRKTSTRALTWAGLALMMSRYGVSEARLVWTEGSVLCGLAYLKWTRSPLAKKNMKVRLGLWWPHTGF